LVVGGNVTVDQRKDQTEAIGDGDAQNRVQGILRQRGWMNIDFGLRADGADPIAAEGEQPIEKRQPGQDDRQISQQRSAAGRNGSPP